MYDVAWIMWSWSPQLTKKIIIIKIYNHLFSENSIRITVKPVLVYFYLNAVTIKCESMTQKSQNSFTSHSPYIPIARKWISCTQTQIYEWPKFPKQKTKQDKTNIGNGTQSIKF